MPARSRGSGPEALREAPDNGGLAFFRVDDQRRIIEWSPAAERLTGYMTSDVLGMPCFVGVRCDACLSGCRLESERDVRSVPMKLHRRDGAKLDIRKSARAEYDETGRFSGAVEVFERDYPRQRPLRSAEPLLRALGRMALLVDDVGQITEVSRDLASTVGRTEAELVGQDAVCVLGSELFGLDSPFRAAVLRGMRREGARGRLSCADGSEVAVSVSVGPIPDADATATSGSRAFVIIRPDRDGEARAGEDDFEGLYGCSPSMHRIFRMVELLNGSDAAVLITGESGTGKELVARAIHQRSRRRSGPFVAVNCAALPESLLEAELFGHVRGAFTGATTDRRGRFEAAHGGTLFLDEVGELPNSVQVKLLRVLQEGQFEKVGSSAPVNVDVRIISATNSDLVEAVAEHRFREDLFYRLHVVPLVVPPLRERPEDIELLIGRMLDRVGRKSGRSLRLAPEVYRALRAHAWPGNVRELENVLEYAVAMSPGQTVRTEDLPPPLSGEGLDASEPVGRATDERPHPRVDDDEAATIRSALERVHWRRAEAARQLGMSRTTLWRKIKLFGLDR